MDEGGETDSPVGCSYLPAAGVSSVTETDMLSIGLMVIVGGCMKSVNG